MIDIIEWLEEEGYDLSKISEVELNRIQDRFEDEMEDVIVEWCNEHRKELVFENAGALGVKKKK